MTGPELRVAPEVLAARAAALDKHAPSSIEELPPSAPDWLAILVEEVGEVARALTYDGNPLLLRRELVDVLAVASAWVDAIDRAAAARPPTS